MLYRPLVLAPKTPSWLFSGRWRLSPLVGIWLLLVTPVLAEKRIALSFDDVPRHAGGFMEPDERSRRLLDGLRSSGVRQVGFFVTTGNLDKLHGEGGEERIKAYTSAGHVIGNHSTGHPWLSRTPVEEYLADIDLAEAWLVDRPGWRPWFRYPYLDEGRRDLEKRDAVRKGLQERGLMNAYITVDNYDWHLDALAARARSDGRHLDMEALGLLYAETLVETANFYEEIALRTLGRSPAHVMLLHETDLAALYIEQLVQALEDDGWQVINIDEAYEDPMAESEPDTWFLGSGRVAALAHVAGTQARDLVHERTDEAVLEELFESRVLHAEAE